MNILVVERTFPWPEVSGTSIRVANIVRTLARLGEVDFFLLPHWGTPAVTAVPEELPIARLGRAPRAARKRSRDDPVNQLSWLAMGSLPFSIAGRDYSSARSAFLAWARPRYDLVWMGRAHTYVPLGGLIDAPVIVDFDDLEDRKIDAWLDIASESGRLSSGDGRAGLRTIFRRVGARMFNAANRRRWHALQRRIAAAADVVVVCSEIDQRRLGVPNSVVVPNGYVPPREPLGRAEPGSPPTLTMVGAFGYAPNIDAARFLVKDVLPRVLARFPDAKVRLVGDHDQRMDGLGSVDGVTLAGRVPDITSELARADIAAIPIRFGSGTRVKILEAFAHRIPVVSTTLGCEGLDVTDGQHLFVADGAEAFASGCVALLEDVALRSRLVESAQALYWHRYRWDVIAPSMLSLVRGLVKGDGGRNGLVGRREARPSMSD